MSSILKCPSCGAIRQSRYCAECGEKFISPKDLELKNFLFEELPDEFLHVDGKLPRTMRLLLMQPGALARNYVSGRRQSFVSPLRIYVAIFLMQLVVNALVSGPHSTFLERVHDYDSFGILSHLMATRPNVAWSSPAVAAHVSELLHWCGELATLLIFLLVAGVQELIFFRLHRRYLEHVALALNVAAFFLAAITISELLIWAVTRSRLGNWLDSVQSIIALTALPVYWFFAIRRFYDLKPLSSAVAAALLTLANSVIALGLVTIVYAIIMVTA